jgi:uncharacterized protein (TIGR02246 family)
MATRATTVDDEPETAVHAFLDGWNRHDMALISAALAPDADWINVVGMYWRGRDQIMFAHTAFHQGMFRTNQQTLNTIHKRRLSPTLAVLLVEMVQDAYQIPNGPQHPESLNRVTVVVEHRPEGWRIIHGHNTIVDPRAAANDPVLSMPEVSAG